MIAAWISTAMKERKARIILSMFGPIRSCSSASLHRRQDDFVHVRPDTVLLASILAQIISSMFDPLVLQASILAKIISSMFDPMRFSCWTTGFHLLS